MKKLPLSTLKDCCFFIRLLCDYMVERFPEEVQDWVAFDCAALKSPSYVFCITQIEALWSKYQSVLLECNVIKISNMQ